MCTTSKYGMNNVITTKGIPIAKRLRKKAWYRKESSTHLIHSEGSPSSKNQSVPGDQKIRDHRWLPPFFWGNEQQSTSKSALEQYGWIQTFCHSASDKFAVVDTSWQCHLSAKKSNVTSHCHCNCETGSTGKNLNMTSTNLYIFLLWFHKVLFAQYMHNHTNLGLRPRFVFSVYFPYTLQLGVYSIHIL